MTAAALLWCGLITLALALVLTPTICFFAREFERQNREFARYDQELEQMNRKHDLYECKEDGEQP